MSEPQITIATPSWNHGGVQPTPIRWIVLHDEEYPVRSTSAEDVAAFFRDKTPGNYGSAHYITDADSEAHCVAEVVAAYHAPNLSFMGSIGIEQDGYARFTRAEWLADGSKRTIARTAARCAELCQRWGIPVQYVSAEGLNNGVNGITSHYEVNHSRYGATDHWDPGYNFPWNEFFAMVAHGVALLRDTVGFQKAHGLVADGDSGYNTVIALGSELYKNWGTNPVSNVKPKPLTGYHRYDACPIIQLGSKDRAGFDGSRAYAAKDWPVHVWQAFLNYNDPAGLTAGHPIVTDGVFGDYTLRVTRHYQAARGLQTDGVVGQASWTSAAKKLTDAHH